LQKREGASIKVDRFGGIVSAHKVGLLKDLKDGHLSGLSLSGRRVWVKKERGERSKGVITILRWLSNVGLGLREVCLFGMIKGKKEFNNGREKRKGIGRLKGSRLEGEHSSVRGVKAREEIREGNRVGRRKGRQKFDPCISVTTGKERASTKSGESERKAWNLGRGIHCVRHQVFSEPVKEETSPRRGIKRRREKGGIRKTTEGSYHNFGILMTNESRKEDYHFYKAFQKKGHPLGKFIKKLGKKG